MLLFGLRLTKHTSVLHKFTNLRYLSVPTTLAKSSLLSIQLSSNFHQSATMCEREMAANQIQRFKDSNATPQKATTSSGCPIDDPATSLTIGARGPQLMQDVVYLDVMSHFNRERIPERVVHAKGSGAFGEFVVTHDITKYCKADVFSQIGKKTPMLIRFSTVGGEMGSADTARDPRGFAMKFYTDEGNWDLVGNNTPIFFIRDPILFPSFIHTQKRNPETNLKDPDMFWDFISLRPETCHQVAFLFSDRGIPDGYRHMNGYGSHTFKMVNSKNEPVYVKFHAKTNQGIKTIFEDPAGQLAGSDPDYSQRDLYNAIASGNCPSWTLNIQVMTYEQAKNFKFNPFDVTKIWPHKQHPLIPVGQITLNRNPKDYFSEIEQSAFSPANFVPGIETSPDKMLQGRLFAYHDTHLHRLGTNYTQLPVNCPFKTRAANYQRAGPQTFDNQAGAPNYYPNSFHGPAAVSRAKAHVENISGDVARHDLGAIDNFDQPGDFWRNVLNEQERSRLVSNMAGHLKNAQGFIQQRVVANYTQCDADWGSRLKAALEKHQNANL